MKLTRLGPLAGLLLAHVAFAQPVTLLDETWVSGVGDDAFDGGYGDPLDGGFGVNPFDGGVEGATSECSRFQPCATLAVALSRTVPGGSVTVLDATRLDEVTIRQPVTINARGALGGFSDPPVTNGLVIDAPGAAVTLRGLTFAANASGVSGLRVVNVGLLTLEDCRFTGFTADAIDARVGDGGTLVLLRTSVRESSGAGLRLSSAGAPVTAYLRETSLSGNGEGLFVGPRALVTVQDGVVSGNARFGVRMITDGGRAEVNVEGGQLTGNGVGVEALEGTTVRLSNVQLAQSGSTPTHVTGAGAVETFGNSRVRGACAAGVLGFDAVTLPSAIVGVPVSPVTFGSTGALGRVRYGTTGALPRGVVIDAGVLSGAPLQTGIFPVTLTATDFYGCVGSLAASMSVSCSPVAVSPATLAPAVTGAALNVPFSLQGNTGAQSDFALVGALPIGLSFDGGVLAGTPTQGGTWPLTVSAMNEFGCAAQATLSLEVALAAGFVATTSTLSIPAGPVWVSAPLTVTAHVDAGTASPSGRVSFFDGTTALGSSTVDGGVAVFTTDALALGAHRLSAVFSGDSTFGGSYAPELAVDVVKAPSQVVLAVSGARLDIEVSSPLATPDGEVSVTVDGAAPVTVPLDVSGRAQATAPTSVGEHVVQVRYAGGPRFEASTTGLQYAVLPEPEDAGVIEPVDAGLPAPDAGVEAPDAGGGEPTKPMGCGCAGLDAGVLVIGALALTLRRRRASLTARRG